MYRVQPLLETFHFRVHLTRHHGIEGLFVFLVDRLAGGERHGVLLHQRLLHLVHVVRIAHDILKHAHDLVLFRAEGKVPTINQIISMLIWIIAQARILLDLLMLLQLLLLADHLDLLLLPQRLFSLLLGVLCFFLVSLLRSGADLAACIKDHFLPLRLTKRHPLRLVPAASRDSRCW